MRNTQTIQGLLSIGALICLLAGWFNFFSPEINDFLYQRMFYALIGLSFFFQAPTLANRNYLYPMYIAAALCIIGAFLPFDSRFAVIKTIGLFGGVLISLFNRPKPMRQ